MEKKHWRRQIWIGTALTAVTVSVFFWIRQEKRENEVTLEDGSILHYLGATPGRTAYTEEGLWQRLARKYLPASLQSGIPEPLTIGTSHMASLDGVSFYFVRRNMPEKNLGTKIFPRKIGLPRPKPAGISRYSSWYERFAWVEAVEEGGFVYRPKDLFPRTNIQHSNSGKLEYYPFSLPNFPRRQRQFPVRLYLADEGDRHARDKGGRLIATFMAKNPFPITNFPKWTATDLPSTNIVDDIQVVLNEFECYKGRYAIEIMDPQQ